MRNQSIWCSVHVYNLSPVSGLSTGRDVWPLQGLEPFVVLSLTSHHSHLWLNSSSKANPQSVQPFHGALRMKARLEWSMRKGWRWSTAPSKWRWLVSSSSQSICTLKPHLMVLHRLTSCTCCGDEILEIKSMYATISRNNYQRIHCSYTALVLLYYLLQWSKAHNHESVWTSVFIFLLWERYEFWGIWDWPMRCLASL